MLRSYFKITWRNIKRHRAHTLINVFGLAIGILCCFYILLYILDELSYEKHYANADRIYRVAVHGILGNQDLNTAQTPSPLSRTLKQEFPEVTAATRLQHTPNMLVRFGDRVFNETNFMWVDSNFFDVFAIPMVYGDPKTALKDDHTVVLTLSNARKYFDDPATAIGQIVTFEDGTPYRVSGVVEDAPQNSHFHYGMLCPLSSWEWNWEEFWLNNFMHTYILMHEKAATPELEVKFPAMIRKYAAEHIQRATGMTVDEMEASGGKFSFFLQPLTSIHLHSHLDGELEANSDIRYIYIFAITALFILFIACINFMNLSTSQSAGRSREVGIRKVLGSSKNRLIRQFMIESMLICMLAVVIALIMAQLLLPYFNNITDKNLSIGFFTHWYLLPGMLLFSVAIGILAGAYPAFFLSSFRPVIVLKESLSLGLKGRSLRSLLVVFQFTISIILFITTFMLAKQLHYIQNKRLGFEKENIVIVKRGWAIGQNPDGTFIDTGDNPLVIDAFKADLKRNPQILSVAGCTQLPGENFPNTVLLAAGASEDDQHQVNYFAVDYDFLETFQLELLEGRFFDREMSYHPGLIINETAAKILGLKQPYTEQYLTFPDNEEGHLIPILGMLKDFHYESLHKVIQPLILDLRVLNRTYLCVRIRPENVAETIKYIEQTWLDFIPYKPFEYYFFDESYDNLYKAEFRTGRLFSIFSVLSIFIACLGLFALASFTTERRIREIGIRKTLGASASGILLLITREFARLVIIANIIAWPIAWFISKKSLQEYAYRTNISWTTFLFAGLAALAIAMIAVSYHSLKAAATNPARTLKYE